MVISNKIYMFWVLTTFNFTCINPRVPILQVKRLRQLEVNRPARGCDITRKQRGSGSTEQAFWFQNFAHRLLSSPVLAAVAKYWMTDKQQKCFSHSSGGWKSKVPAWSHGNPLLGLSLLVCPHTVEGARELCGAPFIRALMPFVRAPSSTSPPKGLAS